MTLLNGITLISILLLQLCLAFEENSHFCIRTDPMLLADIEKHINPIADDPKCEILATTLTVKEKETFLNTMCKDYGSSHKEDQYYYFQLHNGDLKGHASHVDICKNKKNPLLAWIPYAMVQKNYATQLNPKEHLSYIAKATDVEREKTELCHFRHSDLATNIPENLFTCIVMVFEDNFYGLDDNIHVLVEILPLMYELRNVTYLPWVNVSASYKTQLGKAALKNASPERRQIYGSVNYAFVEKVMLNTSTVYVKHLEKLPLLFEHKGAVLELDQNGIGGLNVKEKSYFGRIMDPKTSVNLEVIGQWAEHRQEFTANIFEYFGYGIRRFLQDMHNGLAAFITIESTEPVYEAPESTHLAVATVHRSSNRKQHKFERLTNGSNATEVDIEVDTGADIEPEWEGEVFTDEPPSGGNPYPGFYPWSVIGGLIVGAVLLAAIIGMVRTCSKENDSHKYKITENC